MWSCGARIDEIHVGQSVIGKEKKCGTMTATVVDKITTPTGAIDSSSSVKRIDDNKRTRICKEKAFALINVEQMEKVFRKGQGSPVIDVTVKKGSLLGFLK